MRIKPPFFCAIFLLFSSVLFSQTITVNIISPVPNQLVVDSFVNISATASSDTYEITSVVASVQGRQVQLAYNLTTKRYAGVLSLKGLAQNSVQVLQVVATDGVNNQQTASVSFNFNYDGPPVLVIDSTLTGSNANPLIRVKAATIDNDNCTINLAIYSDNPNAPYFKKDFINTIDTILDLSPGDGKYAYIVFKATDTRGHIVRDTSVISVESSPYLKKIFAGDSIFDFNFNKILTYNNGREKITDLSTRETTIIPDTLISPVMGASLLTPYGAIFRQKNKSMWDWNNNSLYPLAGGGNVPLINLRVAGNFATWIEDNYRLYLRNLQDRTYKSAVDNIGGHGSDLADNGIVTYGTSTGNIIKLTYNSYTNITFDSAIKTNYYPLTDGFNIVWGRYDEHTNPASNIDLYLYDGQNSTLLSHFADVLPLPGTEYQVNNKWITYIKLGPTGIKQVWLRDPSGNSTQKTFLNINNAIDLLGRDGSLTLTRSGRKYFVNISTGETIEISSALGKTYQRDSSWYLVLGKGLYKIDLNLVPNSLENSTVIVSRDSGYRFKTADFAGNFKGPANLMRVRITALPINGTLKLNGVAVVANAEISRADLNKLTYVVNPGAATSDSIKWNGSNGINYTANDATMRISIIDPYYSIADGLWSNPAIWKNNTVPPIGADVIVRTKVTADINVTCNSLQLVSPGSITVNTGVTVTILNTL